jgi:hypothetical protein
LKKSKTNTASECRIANIVRDHAMILPEDATPKPDGIFGKDSRQRFANIWSGAIVGMIQERRLVMWWTAPAPGDESP